MKALLAALLAFVSLCWPFDAPARFPRGTPVPNIVNMGGGLMVLNKGISQSLIQSWGTTFYN